MADANEDIMAGDGGGGEPGGMTLDLGSERTEALVVKSASPTLEHSPEFPKSESFDAAENASVNPSLEENIIPEAAGASEALPDPATNGELEDAKNAAEDDETAASRRLEEGYPDSVPSYTGTEQVGDTMQRGDEAPLKEQMLEEQTEKTNQENLSNDQGDSEETKDIQMSAENPVIPVLQNGLKSEPSAKSTALAVEVENADVVTSQEEGVSAEPSVANKIENNEVQQNLEAVKSEEALESNGEESVTDADVQEDSTTNLSAVSPPELEDVSPSKEVEGSEKEGESHSPEEILDEKEVERIDPIVKKDPTSEEIPEQGVETKDEEHEVGVTKDEEHEVEVTKGEEHEAGVTKHEEHEAGVTKDEEHEAGVTRDEEQGALETKDEEEAMDILGNGLLIKRVIEAGQGRDTRPVIGQNVTITSKGKLDDGQEVDSRDDFTFTLGDGDVIQAFDLAVALMDKGEKCELITDSKYAYGLLGDSTLEPNIPSNAKITYDLHLKNVEDAIDSSLMPVTERTQLGDKKRERGNYYYAREEYTQAINLYTKALQILDDSKETHSAEASDLQLMLDTRIKCYNNLALCQYKVEAYDASIKSCDNVLRVQPENVKALFRKGKALADTGRVDEAIAVLKKALALDPQKKNIHVELSKLVGKQKEQSDKEKEMYRRMIGADKSSSPPPSEKKDKSWMLFLLLAILAATLAVIYRFLY